MTSVPSTPADGEAVLHLFYAAGPLAEVLTDEVLSRGFDVPIGVTHRDGRTWARLRS